MDAHVSDATERLSPGEVAERIARCRRQLARLVPQAGGLLLLSYLNIYYFSGTLAAGAVWIPLEGGPVLLVRRGIDRAKEESPIGSILPFRSYGDIPKRCAEAGSPLPGGEGATIAVDMGGVPWSQAEMLTKRMPDVRFVSGDMAVKQTRMRKTAWELAKLRKGGALQHECVYRLLPKLIGTGMTEWEIARRLQETYFDHGHCGVTNVTPPWRVAPGNVSAGVSGLCVSSFDGPLGVRGLHPAVPYMGSRQVRWERGQLLTVDMVFSLDGYCTDKTQCFWGGGSPGEDVARAHACCLSIQRETAAMLVPGGTPTKVWEKAQAMAEEGGYADGFMGMGPEKARYLGHGIGLEMDEYPPLAAKFEEPFEEGVVLAIEPKIALPGIGMVGIENTFVVTPKGGECLTGDEYSLLPVE
jgi:Xaa-Pro dipeptidase